MPYVAASPENWDGHNSVGSGQCVALVQVATGAPPTRNWTKGALVKGNSAIAKGTAIATFGADGKYANHAHGNHAAIYLSQDASGIQVIDPWVDRFGHHLSASKRTISFNNKKGAADNGNLFSVVN